MLITAGFFKQELYESFNKKNNEKIAVDVGAHDLFRAVAAAFVDNFKQEIMLPERDLKILIQPLAFYFPVIMQKEGLLAETMRGLLNNIRSVELIECMAVVLRRLAVTHILANPLPFYEAFNRLPKQCTATDLYRPATPLPFSVLRALTTILPVTIKLSIKEPGKEVRLQHIYRSACANPSFFELLIQVQGQLYFPLVKNIEFFSSLKGAINHWPEPSIIAAEEDSLDPVRRLLEKQEQTLMTRYDHYVLILKNAVMDNELSKEKLISLYKYFSPEASNQQLINYLMQKKQKAMVNGMIEPAQEKILLLLISALATGLSLGQIKEEQFFDALEYRKPASIFSQDG